MNIIGVQLVLLAFAFFMEYVLYLHWKKKNVSNKMFGLWSLVWLLFIFFSIFPNVLQLVIKDLFIVRVMDLGMIVAFMVLTYVTLENNIKITKYEKTLEMLVRKLAIKK